MGSLLEALKKSGLITPDQEKEADKKQEKNWGVPLSKWKNRAISPDLSSKENRAEFARWLKMHKREQDLYRATTMQQFRAAAKAVLLKGEKNIDEIIKMAHRLKQLLKVRQFKYFVSFFYRLREILAEKPEHEHKATIRRFYRKELR